jgi:hypothetical protein
MITNVALFFTLHKHWNIELLKNALQKQSDVNELLIFYHLLTIHLMIVWVAHII